MKHPGILQKEVPFLGEGLIEPGEVELAGVGFDVRKIRIHTQVGSGSCVDPVAEIQSAIRLEFVDSVCAVVYVSSGDERQDVQAQTLL